MKLVTIPKIEDDCFLMFAQTPEQVPFDIKRIYYILEAKPSAPRGSHAHHKTDQILFCIRGTIKIVLDDGKTREEVVLKNPEQGVLVDRMVWHEMHNFKKNTVLLVLASRIYEPGDYIRDYQEFLKLAK